MPRPALLLTAAAGIAVAGLALVVPAVAGPAEDPPSAVEDYAYPGADRIYAELGIKLISGDGHLMMADCPSTPGNDGFIRFRRNLKPTVCFKVAGPAGALTMDIPDVTFVKGDDHTLKVTISSQTTPIDIAKNEWTPLPGDRGSTTLTLVATP